MSTKRMERSRREPGSVAMRCFANWDTDKTGGDIVQRSFSLSINRITLANFPPTVNGVIVSLRLQGHKRILRCPELPVVVTENRIDTDVNVNYTIQYPHFLKRKSNILQILIQRRKRYKSRPIPGGFKTLAIGLINLNQLLQQGSLREVLLWANDDLQKESNQNVQSIGRVRLSACQTQPVDSEVPIPKGKAIGEASEESESESEDEGAENRANPSTSQQNPRNNRMREKLFRRKNLKQRIFSLLKRFRVADEEEATNQSTGSASIGRAPTAKELEALFEELDDLSDSGPDCLVNDDISVASLPRPCLRPYFSRELILPPEQDERSSESDEFDSEAERYAQMAADVSEHIAGILRRHPAQRNASLADNLLIPGADMISGAALGECIWFVPPASQLQRKILLMPIGRAVCASSPQFIKSAVTQIVQKVYHFCTNNSKPPPLIWIGVIGDDSLISTVLRTYIEVVAHRSSTSFLSSIRFALIPPPNGVFGRYMNGADAAYDQMIYDFWVNEGIMTFNEIMELSEKIDNWTKIQDVSVVNAQIGEALLQLPEKESTSRLFVPFISEVSVGQQDNGHDIGSSTNSPRELDKDTTASPATGASSSPPASPHNKQELREMNVEYWLSPPTQPLPQDLTSDHFAGPPQPPPPPPKKSSKLSLKTTFKNILITRSCTESALTLLFVKEKRKMFPKFGMMHRQKHDSELPKNSIPNIARILCVSTQKHNQLSVSVDGQVYPSVSFFQISSQWPTHVRSLSFALMSTAFPRPGAFKPPPPLPTRHGPSYRKLK